MWGDPSGGPRRVERPTRRSRKGLEGSGDHLEVREAQQEVQKGRESHPEIRERSRDTPG